MKPEAGKAARDQQDHGALEGPGGPVGTPDPVPAQGDQAGRQDE